MTTSAQVDISLPFVLKQEREEFNTDDDNACLEDINNLLSISLPFLTDNKVKLPTDFNDEFLRLTTTVRTVYFSYLHKCLLTNYILCYKDMSEDVPCDQLKKCANQMELLAVQSSLEATLYRQNMLKLISDVKSHTTEKKAYKKLVIFLETPPTKVDVGVQTINSWAELERNDNIQSVCITSNSEELLYEKQESLVKEEDATNNIQHEILVESPVYNTASPTIHSTSFYDIENNKLHESDEEVNNKMAVDAEVVKEEDTIFNSIQDNSDIYISNTQCNMQIDDENSQDSLLQHMEDMFCDSDDSSDLMTLIEKHSGVTKANMDSEINKMCLETDSVVPNKSNNLNRIPESYKSTNVNSVKSNNSRSSNVNNGKYSFSYYKEMKNREANKPLQPEVETPEVKQKRRANSIWFVERVYQVSKLKAKMTELSLKNYRRHGQVKKKFIELFGESDDEEMMPDSPICIEEHLTACKERIAPWIVKYLMPFYKKRRIKDRQLFKVVAKHIADMLIIENTFPEQDCVSKYIDIYFKNKKLIRTKQDVYL